MMAVADLDVVADVDAQASSEPVGTVSGRNLKHRRAGEPGLVPAEPEVVDVKADDVHLAAIPDVDSESEAALCTMVGRLSHVKREPSVDVVPPMENPLADCEVRPLL